MSFSAMTWARTVSFGSAVRKAIIYTLADHHNGGTGRCDPSVATIAREADVGVRAVEINLRWLERVGAIGVLRRPGRASSYFLNFNWAGRTPARDAGVHTRASGATPAPDAGGTPAYECVQGALTPESGAGKPERKKDNREEERERGAPASPPPRALASSPVHFSQPEGSKPRRTRLPVEWGPSRAEQDLAINAGFDPEEIREELADWAARNPDKPQADWAALYRAFVRQAKRAKAARPDPNASKRPWLMAALRQHDAEGWRL